MTLSRVALSGRSNEEILKEMDLIVTEDRRRKSDFLAYLNEVDRRKLYAADGYSSLFRFLTEKYHFAESSALKRIQVARLAKRFPFLFRDIADGLYSITALARLAPFLNGGNSARLLRACERQSVRVVEAVIAREFPKADIEDRLQKKISPLGLDRIQIQFMADEAFVRDLDKARALLSHRYPQGRMADVLGLALETLIARIEKQTAFERRTSAGQTRKKPRHESSTQVPTRGDQPIEISVPTTGNHQPLNEPLPTTDQPIEMPLSATASPSRAANRVASTRHIPREIQRGVWRRDNGRCQHKRADGSICAETHFLEIDHIQPFALGGKHSGENLRLLCWAHNQLRAEAQFGRIRRERAASAVPSPGALPASAAKVHRAE